MITSHQLCRTASRDFVLGAIAAVLASVMGGCSSYPSPTLTVTDARVTQTTDAGSVITFNVDATNSAEVALPLKTLDYAVYLNDREVFRGTRSPEATLRRFGTQKISFPAVVAGPVPTAGTAYRVEGVLGYVAPGEIAAILFDYDIERPTVGFRAEGTLAQP